MSKDKKSVFAEIGDKLGMSPAEALCMEGLTLNNAEKYEEAIERFNQAIAVDDGLRGS